MARGPAGDLPPLLLLGGLALLADDAGAAPLAVEPVPGDLLVALVTAEERSVLPGNQPGWPSIAGALREAGINEGRGNWIGPGPRVTRQTASPVYLTRVAQPYAWEATERTVRGVQLLAHKLAELVALELGRRSSDWEVPEPLPYAPVLYGGLSWWASGQAAQTRTQFEAPVGFGQIIDGPENPVGPDDRHPTNAKDVAKTLVLIGGLYLLAGPARELARGVRKRRQRRSDDG